MTIFTDGPRLEPETIGIDQVPTTLGQSLGASAGEAFESLPGVSIANILSLGSASGEFVTPYERAAIQDVPIDQAKARVKEAGLDKILTMPDQPSIKAPALDIMLDRARARRERQATIERGPGGFVAGALGVGTSLLVSAIDPLNVAAAFIPVVGEARYAKLMADAGTSVLARAGVRAGVGAASGAVGMAAIEPIEYAARNQEGQDYTFVDALRSVMYGALLGGSLHTAGGGIADVLRARKGNALYPFGEGEAFAPGAAPEAGAGVRQTTPGRGDTVAVPETPLSEAPIGETSKLPTAPIASRATPQAKPQSLLEFIAKQGGISDQDPLLPDLLQSFGGKIPTVPGSGKLVRAGGKSLDNLREAAVESGYLHDAGAESGGVTQSSIDDLLAAVDAEARGQKVYRAGEMPASTRNQLAEDAARSHEARIQSIKDRDAAFETALDDHEVGDRRGEVKVRARLLMEQDGLADPEAAVAQALSDMGIRQAQHPVVAALNDLPPRAREDALRGAIAALHDGEPVRVGEMLETAAKTDPRIAESLALWHGSPHDFTAFDNGKIGTGEGAQVFAYGHYLAENDAVAAGYAAGVTGEKGARNVAAKVYAGTKNEELVRTRLGQLFPNLSPAEVADALKFAKEKPATVYKVSVKQSREKFLEWESDMSAQPAGRKILREMDPRFKEDLETYLDQHDQPALDDLTGGMFHRTLERYATEDDLPGVVSHEHPKRAVAEYLQSLDVPGITFLDKMSRRGGAFGDLDASPANKHATRNWVVFSDKDVEITHKNGQSLRAAAEPTANWHDFAAGKSDLDEPGALDASQAVAKLSEPPSIAGEPSARVAAAERALAEADADYKANEAYIPADLRAQVERDIAALELEAKDRSEVIQRGAACLAAAVGAMA